MHLLVSVQWMFIPPVSVECGHLLLTVGQLNEHGEDTVLAHKDLKVYVHVYSLRAFFIVNKN